MADEKLQGKPVPKIESANAAYSALIEGSSSSELTADTREKLIQVKEFVKTNLPVLPSKMLEGEVGLVSPAHLLDSCIKFVDSPVAINRKIALDQAARLISSGETRKQIGQIGGLTELARGRTIPRQIDVPYLIEVPVAWRQGTKGQEFKKKLQDFVEARKKGQPVAEREVASFKDMQELIDTCYEGILVDKKEAETAPRAKELLLIQLTLMQEEARKHQGAAMAGTAYQLLQFQLIRGLFNYNAASIVTEASLRGGPFVSEPSPNIVRMPDELKT
ncbi:MAG: hypothetical protein ABIO02_03495 [Patescibacteria group bacterium]